jgi:hypothetical protein
MMSRSIDFEPDGPVAIYSSDGTLWRLIFQRLAGGKSLQATLKTLSQIAPRLNQSIAYAGVRKRLLLLTDKNVFDRVILFATGNIRAKLFLYS